jgi:flagellar motor switch protein FliM
MEKVLSQEEINALFSAMSSEDLGLGKQPERTGSTRQVASYDFHRVDRIPQDQMRSIHLLHEHFGRNFASSLSAYLRTIAEVNVVSLEQESYSAFIKSLPDPTLFASIGMRPLDANMAMELNPSLVFPMIDMILGGPGHPLSENRNLTEIEMNIIDGVIKLALKDLGAAWRAIMEFDFYLEGKGTKPQVFQILSHGETVIAVQLNMKIGDGSGTMNFCIPANVLKMLRGKFDQQWSVRRQKSPGNESERLSELMQPVPLLLSGELRRSTLTLDDLLKITAGDIIELNERIGDPIFLCVGGKEKFIGRIVQRRGKKAFEISDRYAG